DNGRFGDLLDEQTCRLDLLGAEPVAGHVDDVVDPTKDAIVTVLRLQGAVIREIGPVPPILAVWVLAVSLVVLLHEAIWVLPNLREVPGRGIRDADVARAA